jgi:phage-related protein (TIGR01555 family)
MKNWIQSLKRDGWQNILTGLGMKGRDKRVSAVPTPHIFTQQESDDLYRADDIAQKVVDRIPKEMFRAGYDVKVEGGDVGKEIEAYMTRLGADDKMRKAIKLARLYGGAVVVLGIDDGRDAREPVNFGAIRSIKWAQVLDRWQLQAKEIQGDLTKPDYGLPMVYSIQAVSAEAAQVNNEVHASRLIRFDGIELPDRAFVQNNYWHDSVLGSVFSPLQLFNTGFDSGGTMLADFNQTVYKMQNLADLLASGDDVLVQKRLALLDASRSVVRAIVIQEGESFERTASNLTGAPDMLRMIANRLVAATNMPHTLILGEGSTGQTTGRSEETDFLNSVAQEQET